jgi:hypothetical protein
LFVWSALLQETSAMLAKRLNAQIKLDVFMAANFPRVRPKVTPEFNLFASRAK